MHLMNNYGQRTITMVRGQGAYLYDNQEKEYLDFTAGIAVCNLGHAHPTVTEAICRQAGQLLHCSNLYLIPAQQQLAAKLTHLSGLQEAMFCNSGAEANEAALKLARKYASQQNPSKTTVLSLPNAFHGRTMGALSLTPKPAYHRGYTPLVPDCVTPPTWDAVLEAIDEDTAAVFVEIIQGEGGVRPVPSSFLEELQKCLRAVGALLVVDEVQTGVGRTGSFFAYEQVGLTPDIVTMAKGLGNGMPIGAVLARKEVADAFQPGSHGSTFGGNPLATTIANVVVDIVSQQEFLDHVQEMGRYFASVLQQMGTNVTGNGLMWGFDVPDAKSYVKAAADKGVLLTAVGEQRVRCVPPLIIEKTHIDEFKRRLSTS